MAALAAATLLAGCATTPEPQTPPAANLSPQERWDQGQAAYLAWNAKRPGWTVTESGLAYKVVKRAAASAPKPAPGVRVTIHYSGTFIDGRPFDSSRDGEPVTFPLNRLIKGWQEGVPMMRVGERWLFAIPADLAYGSKYRDPIPANSALLFDIELFAIPPADATE